MKAQVRRVAWYRFRSTFRRRVGGLVALAVLIGLLGGVAMGAVAAARRTESSYPTFLASTNPSDLALETASVNPGSGSKVGYDPTVVARIRHLPHVKHVESYAELNAYPLNADGTLNNVSVPVPGSVDGLYFNQDRITVTQGRMANPARANEIVMAADVARSFHLRIGSFMTWGFYSNAQNPQPGIPAAQQPAHLRARLELVGIGQYNYAVVQDDIDSGSSIFVLFTPALTRQLTQCCTQNTETALQLDHGSRDVSTVEAELEQIAPSGGTPHFSVPSNVVAKTQRAIKPDAIALGVFGLIAALAALLIACQVIARQLRVSAQELEGLRALGAGPAMTASDGLIGIVGAVVVGTLLAVGVAVGLSPLGPIGPVRPLYPHRGIAFDWTVFALGVGVLIVVLSVAAIGLAIRGAPHRVARRSRLIAARRPSAATRVAAESGLSAPAVTGIRYALESGRGRDAVPVRSAIFGAALAIVVLVGTVTFGASLHTLVSRPALYGWNWNYELIGGGSVGAIPDHKSTALLGADHDVAAWSQVYYNGASLDGHAVPILGGRPDATVRPPLLSGHGLEANDQVVLGAITLSELHKHVGDSVTVTNIGTKRTRLRIVGTATMPTIGINGGGNAHLTMGEGALLSSQIMSASDRNLVGNVPAGPEGIFVRLRAGVNPNVALRGLNRIATTLSLPTNYGVQVDAVQRPAEIVNYHSMTATPAYLGVALAAGAIAALALTLIASVRRRRRDLALLKTIGFTRRQLAAVVAWQSTVAVAIGTIIGVPIGIIVGRALWNLFANEIHAVPEPVVPTLPVVLIGVGGVVLANLVAAIPARSAAKTPTSVLLRGE